jgi:hypothetical protein
MDRSIWTWLLTTSAWAFILGVSAETAGALRSSLLES